MLTRRSFLGSLVPVATGAIGMPEVGAAQRAVRALERRIAKGLTNPHPASSRALPIDPPVMSDPPTITNTVTSSDTLMGGSTKFAVRLTDDVLRIFGGPLTSVAPGGTYTYYRVNYGNWSGMVWGFEFETDAPTFEVPIFGPGEINLLIDDEWARAESLVFTNTAGQRGLVSVAFGDGTSDYAQPRRIRVLGIGLTASLIRTPSISEVWATSAPKPPRWGWITDSFGQGRTEGGPMPEHIGYRVSRLFGATDVISSSVGGTGFMNPGPTVPTTKKYRDRLGDLIDNECEVAFFLGGYNDTAYTQADIQGEMQACYDETRAGLPQAPIVFVVPTYANTGQTVSVNWTKSRDAALAVVQGSADTHAYLIDPLVGKWYAGDGTESDAQGQWLTGNGRTGNPLGSGNTDLYVGGSDGADVVHPSPAGYGYWADRIAGDLASIIQTRGAL